MRQSSLLRKTLQAAASRVSGDLSVALPLGNTLGAADNQQGYAWSADSQWQAPSGVATNPKSHDSPRQTWPVEGPGQPWTAATIPTPAGPALTLPGTQPGASASASALLASLLSQKLPSALQQQDAARSSGLATQHLAGRRLAPHQLLPQQRLPGARGSTRSIALNKDITATSSIDQLLALVTNHGHEFDFFNISTAISRMPKLVTDHSHVHGANQKLEHDGKGSAAANSAHLSAAVKEVADRLCQLALRHVHEFDGRGIANTAWAFAKLRYVPDPALPAALCRAAVTRIDQFAAQNISNLAWALVYLHYQDEQLMQLLKRKACEQVFEMKPQELANMMWALASHEQLDERTAMVLGQRAARLAAQFKEQELSNVVWAMGRCGHAYEPALLEPLLTVVRSKLGSFMPQGISNMVWALGQLGHNDPELLSALSRDCPPNLHTYDSQALSNLATGLAALGHPSVHSLMAAVANEAAGRGTRMAPQHMASVLAAAATLGVLNDRLVSAAVDVLHTRASNLESSTLAALAGAAVALNAHAQPPASSAGSLLASLCHAVMASVDKLHGQALATLVVHFTTLVESPMAADVLPALVNRLPSAVGSFNPQQAADVTHALRKAGVLTADVAPALLRHATSPTAGSGQEVEYAAQLADTLQAVARMGFNPDPYQQEALLEAVQSAMTHMNVSQLCSSCWSLAAMGLMDDKTLRAFAALVEGCVVSGALETGAVGHLQLQQMFDAHLLVAAQLSQRLGLPLTAIPPHMVPRMPPLLEQAWTAFNQGMLQAATTQMPINTVSPFGAPAVQADTFSAPVQRHANSRRGSDSGNPTAAARDMAALGQNLAALDLGNAYGISAEAIMAAAHQATVMERTADDSAVINRQRGRGPPRPAASFNAGRLPAAAGAAVQLSSSRGSQQSGPRLASRPSSSASSNSGGSRRMSPSSSHSDLASTVQAAMAAASAAMAGNTINSSAAAQLGLTQIPLNMLAGRAESLEDIGGGFWLPRDLLSAAPSAAGPMGNLAIN